MKKISIAFLALTLMAFSLTPFQMASCKKSLGLAKDCPPTTYPITGIWEGGYKTDQVAHASTYISFAIYPDGTFIRRGKVVGFDEMAYFKGRWMLQGNTLTYRDTTVSYSGGYLVSIGSLDFSSAGTMSNGTWTSLEGQDYTGTFQNIKRVN